MYLLKTASAQGILDPQAGLRTPAEIAAASGSDPGRIALLCSTLLSYGVLTQDGDKFALSERFRTILPSEAASELSSLLESEEHRLRLLEATADVVRKNAPEVGAELVLSELSRGPHQTAEELESNGHATTPSPTPADNAGDGSPAGAALSTLQATVASKGLANETSNGPAGLGSLPALNGAGVKAKVQPPAVPIPPRRRYRSPVTPRTLALAFASTWPLGPMGTDVIEGALRTGVRLRPVPKRSLRHRLGTLLWVAAAICIAWAAWDLWGTAISQAEAQRELKAQFTRELAEPRPADAPTVPSSVPGDAPAPVAFAEPPPKPLPGTPVAVLRIPSINLEQTIIEGVGVADLRKGPGHYPGTVLPGQPGNAAIAGHRTTYGAPFYKLGKLEIGDEMHVTTTRGSFVYKITRIYRVDPTDTGPLAQTGDNLLTLTTCDPPFSDAQRLIVVGRMVGEPDAVPTVVAPRSDPVPSPSPVPQETVAPGLSLRAIPQPGAAKASPTPAPAGRQSAAPPPPNPNPAPAAAPAGAPAETTATPPQPTTTTAPPANPDESNPFLQPRPAPPPTTQTAPTIQPTQPSGSGNAGVAECSDGIDNDRNGKIDLEDRGCDGDPNEDE